MKDKYTEYEKLKLILTEVKNDVLAIGDILAFAIGYDEKIDMYLLNEKLHQMYLKLDFKYKE